MPGLWPEIRAELNGTFWVPAATLFTVNGTAVPDPFGPGFAADCGRGLQDVADGLYNWQPIGYPAATIPMGPSVLAGAVEVINQINRWEKICADRGWPQWIALSGYSQGALVTDIVWRDYILNPAGSLNHRLGDVIAICNFGDPMRCPGIAHGNERWGRALPKAVDGSITGGIAGPNCLTPEQTPDFLLSFALDGDIYACAPVGATPWVKETTTGHDMTIIFNAVQNFNGKNILAFAEELVHLVSLSLGHLISVVQAIWNGLAFLAKGTQAPHWLYDAAPAVGYLIERANAVAR